MDKREIIERALYPKIINAKAGKSRWRRVIARGLARFFASALVQSKQAIVIEYEAEHKEFVELGLGKFTKIRTIRSPYYGDITILHGHHGPPGKAIAIILSLEKENDGETC